MDINKAGEEWAAMHQEWSEAFQAANEANHAVTAAFRACSKGNGTGPTMAQIDKAEKLQQVADDLKLKEAEFLRSVFG